MRILLDNCVPRSFERSFADHEVIHCSRMGWEKLSNGKLLAAAEDAAFEVVLTVDQNIQFQQNMAGRQISVIYLRMFKNDIPSLSPMASLVEERLHNLLPGSSITIEKL